MPFSQKQCEYIRSATRRWNFKTGAARSGKTFLDYMYVVPRRIKMCEQDGLIVLIGNTRNSVERNVLAPMRDIWTKELVGEVKSSDGTVVLFGKRCYVLGADRVSAVPKLQGTGIAYCYGDEVATWNKEVFEMLKSRLDKPHSVFDGTTNPEHPGHWLKKFLDSGADIYRQHYTIEDNPFLSEEFVRNLKKEYENTVYYDRLILGKWVAAEGAIYRQFAKNPQEYMVEADEKYCADIEHISVGIDFGGTRSLTAFVASGIHKGYRRLTVLKDHHISGKKGDIDAERVCVEFANFMSELRAQYPAVAVKYVFADSEAQYLINSLRRAMARCAPYAKVGDAAKKPIIQRIVATNTLLNTGRLKISRSCRLLSEGLMNSMWDDKRADTRRDDFSSDIDVMDAFEYSWERYMNMLCKRGMT